AEDGIRDGHVTGVQTCALPISSAHAACLPRRHLVHNNLNQTPSRRFLQISETRSLASIGFQPMPDFFKAKVAISTPVLIDGGHKIGRASCRERVRTAKGDVSQI